MLDLETTISNFQNIVSPEECNKLAKQCRFVQRSTSKIQGYEFAQAMMIPHESLDAETLNTLAERMRDINKECAISASALAQRINKVQAVRFMKACFAKVLKEIVKQDLVRTTDLSSLSKFGRILIEDSTKIELNEHLSPHFKGTGGAASKSALKINFILDYLTEEFVDIQHYSGSVPDQTISKKIISIIKPGDLVIRDLGYFVLKRLKEIAEAGAYYSSRWKVNENVYESEEASEPLDLAKFIEDGLKTSEGGILDVWVFVGTNDRFKTRLIACRMSGEAINKRIRQANKCASRHGTKISDKKRRLLCYAIFITNIPGEMLSAKDVMAVYRARWRIELIFKEWKSCLKIHYFKGENLERVHCFIYARLIMCLLMAKVYAILATYASKIGREISGFKLMKHLIVNNNFLRAIQKGEIAKYVNQLLVNMPRRFCMDKRNRKSLRSNVRSGTSYYEDLITLEEACA